MSSTERILEIGSRRIGPGEPCYVIAEVGINHNGSLDVAKRLVDAAVSAGADAVKFQKRKLSETYRQEILDEPRHGEQGLQYIVPLLKEFELSDGQFGELFDYCRSQGITALCTPWDRGSVDFLETCDIAAYKIGSPDLTNFPLIEHVIGTGKPMLLSTGMSTEEEVRRTLAFLETGAAEYGLFHCVSTYPAAAEEINLRFMERLREWSRRPVGYSGHDTGIAISLAAVAMGARLLERHLTIDRTMRGPDHKASLEPAEFAEQVRAIREVELSLGVPHRWITRGETLNRRVLGKSLVAAVEIPPGTAIGREMLTSKSPGLGLSPQFVDRLVGRRLTRAIARDEMFRRSDIEDTVNGGEAAAIDVGAPWGIVARFLDVAGFEERFLSLGMRFIEFHVSDRDLDGGVAGYTGGQKPFGFVVHAPGDLPRHTDRLVRRRRCAAHTVGATHPKYDRPGARSRAAVRLGSGPVSARAQGRDARRRHVAAGRGLRPVGRGRSAARRAAPAGYAGRRFAAGESAAVSLVPSVAVGSGTSCATSRARFASAAPPVWACASIHRMLHSSARAAVPVWSSLRKQSLLTCVTCTCLTAPALRAKVCRSATARSTSWRCCRS